MMIKRQKRTNVLGEQAREEATGQMVMDGERLKINGEDLELPVDEVVMEDPEGAVEELEPASLLNAPEEVEK